MGFWKAFVEGLSPEGRQKRYNNAYERMTGAPPPPKKQGQYTFHLYLWIIRRHQNTATIHLHGKRATLFHGAHRRIEYITVRMLPGETEAEFIRCAVWMSPNKWKIPFSTNVSQFGGKFYKPLDDRLRSTITDPSQISSSQG